LDLRVTKHADVLVNYSTKVKKGDNVLIQLSDEGIDLATEIYKKVAQIGGNPLIINTPSEAVRGYYELTPKKFLKNFPTNVYSLAKESDVFISIFSSSNTRFLSNTDPQLLGIRSKAIEKIRKERLKKRWCLTVYPNNAFAQEADMALVDYENFVYSAILRDWEKEKQRLNKLKKAFESGKEIRLVAEGTDLTMSVKGRKFAISDGTHNMPGGEVFSAPVEDSVDGEVSFDLPAIYHGREVLGIKLKFEKGEIIDFSAAKNESLLKSMINTDKGSKRLGELGIGTNAGIPRFSKNILFDEKIYGTIHLAIGMSYEECGGKNKSAIHWDMIKSMKKGKIILDGKIVQDKGKFRV